MNYSKKARTFLQEQESEPLHDARCDRRAPEDPEPGALLCDPRAGDGTNDRAGEKGQRIEGNSLPALFGAPDVAEDAAANLERDRGVRRGERGERNILVWKEG